MEGRVARDTNVAENAMIRIDKIAGKIQDKTKKAYGSKTDKRTREVLDKKLNDFLMSDNYLTPNIKKTEGIKDIQKGKPGYLFDVRKIPKTDPMTNLPYRLSAYHNSVSSTVLLSFFAHCFAPTLIK